MKSNEPTQMINTVNKMLAPKYLLEVKRVQNRFVGRRIL
jgi:hypothetical protein